MDTPSAATEEFLRVLDSHLTHLAQTSRRPRAILICRTEAGRFDLGEISETTRVFGYPVELDNSVHLGRARIRLDDGSLYELALPVRFAEN